MTLKLPMLAIEIEQFNTIITISGIPHYYTDFIQCLDEKHVAFGIWRNA